MTTIPDTSNPLADLSAARVSLWLDDLSRYRLTSGNLGKLINEKHVVEVTTNPTIFQSALKDSDSYREQIVDLAARGAGVDTAVQEIITDDVRAAADLFRSVHARTGGTDGRVSIEVDPRLANDTAGTVAQVWKLVKIVDRDNVLIKIPATLAGLPAITAVIAEGISVNVTLIFSLDRYAAVMDAYLTGLEQAQASGRDLAGIHSVASFFVSRVDAEVDRRLTAIGGPAAESLLGCAAIANARLAYELYEQTFAGERWVALRSAGAHPQRPLWASTGSRTSGTTTPATWSNSPRPARSTPHPRRPSRRSPTMASSAGTPSPERMRRHGRYSPVWPGSVSI